MVSVSYTCQNLSNSFLKWFKIKTLCQTRFGKEVWQSNIHATFSCLLEVSLPSITASRVGNEGPATQVNRNAAWVTRDTSADHSFSPSLSFSKPACAVITLRWVSMRGYRNLQNLLIIVNDNDLSYTRQLCLEDLRFMYILILPNHCHRHSWTHVENRYFPSTRLQSPRIPLISRCFCSNPGLPWALSPSDYHPLNCGHMALCRTWGNNSPQQCWHLLWTRERIHAAPRSSWGCHTWPLLRVITEPPKTHSILASNEGKKALQSFRRPWAATQIWQKLVSLCNVSSEAQKVWDLHKSCSPLHACRAHLTW